MEWLGHAKISFTHSPNVLPLKTKDGSSTDLLKICEEVTPPCRLNPLLFNGHLQTMWTAIKNDGPPIHYKRKIFEAEDPAYEGSFAVDFVTKPNSGSDNTLPIRTTYFNDEEFERVGSLDDRPMLVTLHGLSGGSYEIYLKHVLAPLTGVNGEGKWEACVVNSRGCAMSKITSPVLYNARATWDCRQTVSWLRKKFPNRPLFGIGFSLGANILTNYLGEEGASCVLKAAVVCSNPWNLDTGSLALQRTWLGREVYSKTMGSNMKKLIELHYDQVSKNPSLDFDKIRKVKYLHEFDREVQGPTWGYPTEGAYYRDASSVDSLLAVRVPLFAINAEDDPIAVNEALPYMEVKQTPGRLYGQNTVPSILAPSTGDLYCENSNNSLPLTHNLITDLNPPAQKLMTGTTCSSRAGKKLNDVHTNFLLSHATFTPSNVTTSQSMHSSGGLRYEEASGAASEGMRGAVIGAAKWGMYSAILGGAGYAMSPIYRGLTIQFKVFLQMSGMIMGACLEADHRIREYEARVRMQKRMMRDRAMWEQYEQEFEQAPPEQRKSQ